MCSRCASRCRHGARTVLPADTCGSYRPPSGQLSPAGGHFAAFLHPHVTGQNANTFVSMLFSFALACEELRFVSVSVWIWRRDGVRHRGLQFWSQRCRKAASLQGTSETQSRWETVMFPTHRFFSQPFHFMTPVSCYTSELWPLNVQNRGWVGHFVSSILCHKPLSHMH